MPVYETSQLLNNLQKHTEEFLNKAITGWQMISPAQLLRQPAENKWSAAQCLEHLNSYGRYYLPEIEKAIEAAKRNGYEATDHFKPGLLGNYFTNLMLPKEGTQNKMKAPKEHQPIADLDSDKVLSEFIDQQEKFLALIDKARAFNLNKARVPISISKFIKLQLGDTFSFIVAHNHRHVLQAERAIAAAPAQREESFIRMK